MKPAPPVTTARTRSYPRAGARRLRRNRGDRRVGKATQAALLAEHRARRGREVVLHFPLYDENPFSVAVADYLNGVFGGVGRGASWARRRCSTPATASTRGRGDPAGARARHDRRLRPLRRLDARATRGEARAASDRARVLDWLEPSSSASSGCRDRTSSSLLDLEPALARTLVGRKAARSYTAMRRTSTRARTSTSPRRGRSTSSWRRATPDAGAWSVLAGDDDFREPRRSPRTSGRPSCSIVCSSRTRRSACSSAALADEPGARVPLPRPGRRGQAPRGARVRRRAARRPRTASSAVRTPTSTCSSRSAT